MLWYSWLYYLLLHYLELNTDQSVVTENYSLCSVIIIWSCDCVPTFNWLLSLLSSKQNNFLQLYEVLYALSWLQNTEISQVHHYKRVQKDYPQNVTVFQEVAGHYQLNKEALEEGPHHIVEIEAVVYCLLHHRWGLKITIVMTKLF